VAAELNSRFLDGRLTNALRYTYSHQYEPRSYDGGIFPTVDILEDEEVKGAMKRLHAWRCRILCV